MPAEETPEQRRERLRRNWRKASVKKRANPEWRAWHRDYKREWEKRRYATDPEYRAFRLADAEARRQAKLPALQALVLEAKAAGCLLCDETEPVSLDFHHRDESQKRFKLSQLHGSRSPARVAEEIAKCVVLCANCHRKVHAGSLIAPGCKPPIPFLGRKRTKTWCKPGSRYGDDPEYREEFKRKVTERRRRLVAEARKIVLAAKASGCRHCPETDPACLDLHHTDPSTKSFNVASQANRGVRAEVIEEEVKKCVPVCANCHRKLHAGLLSMIDLT